MAVLSGEAGKSNNRVKQKLYFIKGFEQANKENLTTLISKKKEISNNVGVLAPAGGKQTNQPQKTLHQIPVIKMAKQRMHL